MPSPLQQQQAIAGATFGQSLFSQSTVPLSFGNDDAALAAVATGVTLSDRSHWGRIRVTGADRLRFLHNQTTNQLEQCAPGEGCDTVFVNSTARTLDLVTAYIEPESVLLLVSPGQAQPLIDWMDRYIFFADQVTLVDETETTAAFTLMGPERDRILTQLGLPSLVNAPADHHETITIKSGTRGEIAVKLAVGSGLATPGYTLIGAADSAADLWQNLMETGVTPLGEQAWEQLRISQGRPMPNRELTDEINPLEAALWQAVSFEKGCYIGQETIARLNTYQGVKQQLWGFALADGADPGTAITLNGDKVGRLTSVVKTAAGMKGLGYLRTKAGGAGLVVDVAETTATVVEIPFASRGYLAEPVGERVSE
ncbi:MAG: folate-binding protein YgfZ [Leptolyngbya sp. RL_3_1]|nr:folate-binding protein YgfZ [Leptolyngbya sp. RL_3_1]